jgi:medium-chain acyl-[acyl-carrier-protein] hydrolase
VHLFAAARSAPQLPQPRSRILHLPDAEFVAALHARFDGIPKMLLDDPETLARFLPAIRADLSVNRSYRAEEARPIPCPITVFGGVEDRTLTAESLAAWSAMTHATFRIEMFPGGHFFPQTARPALLASIARDLDASAPPKSVEPEARVR